MNNIVLNLLRDYKNTANLEDLKENVKNGSLRILWEFNSSETNLYYSSLKKIFNIKNITFSNQINEISENDIDAVFILCPYDRNDRIKVVKWGIKYKKPIYILEAGLISSIYTLSDKESPISFHVDTTGSIYLDGDSNNEVINFLNSDKELDNIQFKIARNIIDIICLNGISKYNYTISKKIDVRKDSILIIDQTLNDFSVDLAGASQETFQEMMDTAISMYPKNDIYIKIHPEVLSGNRKGNIKLNNYIYRKGIYIISEQIPINILFKYFNIIYTVSSTLGFEAILYGKEVHCFGKNFYGGWGLTKDHIKFNNRLRNRKIEDLVYAIYVRSSFYLSVLNNKNNFCLDAIDDFIKLINIYKEHNLLINYIVNNINYRFNVIEKELKIVQTNLYELKNKNFEVNQYNKDNLNINKRDICFSMFKNKIKKINIEKNIIKFIVNEKKFKKYLRDRESFFDDSKNLIIRIYGRLIK